MTATKRKSRTGGQPGRCSCCSLPADQRAVLERLHVGGASDESLARRFGMSRWSVARHTQNHLSQARRFELCAGPVKVGELVNRAADESKSLLEYLGVMRSVLFSQFLAAAEAGDRHGVATVSQQLLASLRELGKITGELRTMAAGISVVNNTINVSSTPEYLLLEEGLRKVIQRHPDAREDILELMAALDAMSTSPGPNGASYPALIEGEAFRAEEIEVGANVDA
jgi:hypothetical protein